MIVILFRKKTQNDNIQLHLLTYKLLVTFVTDNANHMSWKVITFFILTILLVVFTVQNQILLNIQFIHWELKDVPVVYILIAGLIFGFLLSMIIQLPTIMKLRRELRKVVHELEDSEKIEPVKDEGVDSEDVSMGSDYKGGFFNE
jgi:uncharacterized integral membrane protein